MRQTSKIIIYLTAFIIVIVQVLPYIISAAYSFPLQDDYYNTSVLLTEMNNIHKGALRTALLLAYKGYFEYRGYYFSLFLIYLTDGITRCSIKSVRALQNIMLLMHYMSLTTMIYTVTTRIMKLRKDIASVMIPVIIACFTSMFYFVNNETLFWLCASAVYQIPSTFIYIYTTIYISGIETKKKAFYPVLIILGFLIGGASVNVAVLSCIVACQLIYWGCIVKKQIKYSIVCGIPVITGSALNVLSPGNYRTDSTVTSTDKFLEVFKGSAIYEYERIKMFITEYPLFITVILIFIILFLISDSKYTYSFPVPLIYTILLVLGELATIFPTQWASGVEAYAVYERCIIISDWTSFLLIFLIVFYWTGWIKVRFNIEGISSGKTRVSICMAVLCIFGIVSFMQGDKNASYRLAHELKDGHVQEYCKWVESIIHEVESSDEQIVEIHTKEVKDTTCMANAFFNIGIYDPDTYVGNSAMGNFYGKKAVYIIDEE